MKLRSLRRQAPSGELDEVATVLHETFLRDAAARGAAAPWAAVDDARRLVERYLADENNGHGLVAEDGDAIAGVGFLRRRGEVATLGPLCALTSGQGTGGQILDELIEHADAWGCVAVRLFQDAWNPDSFALYAGRSFFATDVVACVVRPPSAPPRLDAARGLEIAPFRPADLAELVSLDVRLTGLSRPEDLAERVRLVARRRGVACAFLGWGGTELGPALGLDVADLFVLVARALGELPDGAQARLSTAVPTAMPAALALGFRVQSLGTVMVRGVSPPARPPQIYSMSPEIL